jgi:hypothetical protein
MHIIQNNIDHLDHSGGEKKQKQKKNSKWQPFNFTIPIRSSETENETEIPNLSNKYFIKNFSGNIVLL